MFILYPNLVDCTVASLMIGRANIERYPLVWDTLQQQIIDPMSILAEDRYPYRLLLIATKNGQPVTDPETDGPTLAWAIPAHETNGWFVPWPEWGNASLQSALPNGGSLVATVTPDTTLPSIGQGQLNQIKVALYGNASKPCAVFANGWAVVTPLARHGDLARGRGGAEVGAAQAWVSPEDAGDAFDVGARVDHNGEIWESLVPANAAEPGTNGWVKV